MVLDDQVQALSEMSLQHRSGVVRELPAKQKNELISATARLGMSLAVK